MNLAPARLLVAIADSGVFIKIAGRANFSASVDFKTLMRELAARGYRRFTLDLTECAIMDSTFLGVLAGFSLKRPAAAAGHPPIQLLNPNPRIVETFDTMGIASMFEVITGVPPLADYEEAAPTAPASRVELARTSLEAHQTLMEISPANVSKFKDVARFLAEDLKQLESRPEDAPPSE
jgi:anti-sigma B factor antagonist